MGNNKTLTRRNQRDRRIRETGQLTLERHGENGSTIHMITISGESGGAMATWKLLQNNKIRASLQLAGHHRGTTCGKIRRSSYPSTDTMGGDVERSLAT